MVFSVLPGVDEGAKLTVPDLVANQAASDLTKEVTTDAPLEPQGESGASIQLFFIISLLCLKRTLVPKCSELYFYVLPPPTYVFFSVAWRG